MTNYNDDNDENVEVDLSTLSIDEKVKLLDGNLSYLMRRTDALEKYVDHVVESDQDHVDLLSIRKHVKLQKRDAIASAVLAANIINQLGYDLIKPTMN
ncbi:MAG: hypothetical protein RIB53_00955 [Roseitalea porphyridii]|jgi:hypothetical protein|uniref:hypothetical protein n=1 Tax=Roseitalea porphyridii TaxID=1852022 RepID=UPI0032EDD0C1